MGETMKPFYHVSIHPNLTTLTPSIPDVFDDEPKTPRICVCPSMALAYDASGIERYGIGTRIYVYAVHIRPDVTPDGAYDAGVIDALDTREYWYLTPVPCELIDGWTI